MASGHCTVRHARVPEGDRARPGRTRGRRFCFDRGVWVAMDASGADGFHDSTARRRLQGLLWTVEIGIHPRHHRSKTPWLMI